MEEPTIYVVPAINAKEGSQNFFVLCESESRGLSFERPGWRSVERKIRDHYNLSVQKMDSSHSVHAEDNNNPL
jgi:hypothetical protein